MKAISTASVFVLFIVFLYSCRNDKGLLPPAPPAAALTGSECDSVKYAKDIQPFFNAYCVSCHVSGNPNGDFTDYNGASAKSSSILNRVHAAKDMPPAGSTAPTDAEREKIKCWVDKGALNN